MIAPRTPSATARAMYAAMAAGEISAAVATLAADVEWTEAAGFPYAGTYVGPDAVREGVFARLGSEWDGFAAVPDELVESGDRVAVLGWYSGTARATGQAFRARYVHWFTVRDGLVSRFEQVCDTEQVAAALT